MDLYYIEISNLISALNILNNISHLCSTSANICHRSPHQHSNKINIPQKGDVK